MSALNLCELLHHSFGFFCCVFFYKIKAGIIGLPQAVAQCGNCVLRVLLSSVVLSSGSSNVCIKNNNNNKGVVAGIILLCVVAAMADFTSRLLVRLSLDCKKKSCFFSVSVCH